MGYGVDTNRWSLFIAEIESEHARIGTPLVQRPVSGPSDAGTIRWPWRSELLLELLNLLRSALKCLVGRALADPPERPANGVGTVDGDAGGNQGVDGFDWVRLLSRDVMQPWG